MLSAKELVALNISALPSDYRNIERRAVRERWAFVTRPSRGRNGKTRLYVVERLPEPYRSLITAALIEKQVAEHGVNTQGSGCLKDDGVMRGRGIATSATHSRNDGKGGEIAKLPAVARNDGNGGEITTLPAVARNDGNGGSKTHPTARNDGVADGVAVRGALGVKKLPFARLLEKPQGAGSLKGGVGGQEIATPLQTTARNDGSRLLGFGGSFDPPLYLSKCVDKNVLCTQKPNRAGN